MQTLTHEQVMARTERWIRAMLGWGRSMIAGALIAAQPKYPGVEQMRDCHMQAGLKVLELAEAMAVRQASLQQELPEKVSLDDMLAMWQTLDRALKIAVVVHCAAVLGMKGGAAP